MTERRYSGSRWVVSVDGTTWMVDPGDTATVWFSADLVVELERRNTAQGLHMATLEAQVMYLEAELRELREGGSP